MDETPAIELPDSASRDEPQPPESSLPPLRLHHFFVLTAVAAVLMSTWGPAIGSVSTVPVFARYWIVIAAGGTIYSLLMAFAITVTAYGFFWHRRGINYPRYPGHWLLVAIAASYVLSCVLIAIVPASAYQTGWISLLWRLPPIGVDVFIGWNKCNERRWRWTFYLRAFASVVPILGDFPLLIMISRANLRDRRLGVRRDILHRCGVAVQITLSLMLVGFFVLIMLAALLGRF